MKYMLMIYGDEAAAATASQADQTAEYEAYDAFTKWVNEQGIFVSGEALLGTPTATTVRVRDGKSLTTDGPFAETKEQLGGFYLVDCKDLDAAIEAASRIPGAKNGAIEVRPVMEF